MNRDEKHVSGLHMPLRFWPAYSTRVWGGRLFETEFGRKLPDAGLYGESLEICDRPKAESIMRGGIFDGSDIRRVLSLEGEEIMGPGWKAESRFPLLVKWLDCRQWLSLQVHPGARAAALLGGEKKSEAWYFLKCADNAEYVAGLQENTDAQRLVDSLESGDIEKRLRFRISRPGDFAFIPGGCVHAIGAGNLVLEIQENSDTTYRIYDWNRLDINGKARDLHVREAVESADFASPPPEPISDTPEPLKKLCSCDVFSISRVRLAPGESFNPTSFKQARLITLLGGEFENLEINRFETVLLPYHFPWGIKAKANCEFILTEDFYRPKRA